MDQLRQVLNAKAMRDESRRRTLLAIFGAEGEGEEEEDVEEETPDPDSDSEDEEEDDDSDSTQTFPASYVKKLRQEAAANRKQAAELKQRLDAIEEQDLSEKEKAERKAQASEERANKAEQRLLKLMTSNRVESVARDLNFNDPDDAHLLLAMDELDTDEDNIPTSKAIKSALRKLVTEKPYLVNSTSADGGAHGDNPPTDRTKQRKEELVKAGRVVVN